MLEKKDNLMMTEVDEGRGLVKTTWDKVRDRVAKVEPMFAKLVDEIGPDKSFPVFLAYYPYGELLGDGNTPFIPKIDKGHYRLSDPSAPQEVIKHLGYGKNHSPLGMVLEKSFEFFIDLPTENITIPCGIYSPGSIFSYSRNLSKNSSRVYAPNGILSGTAGARSAFLLPNIGCIKNFKNLKRGFNLKSPAPKNLYEHGKIFKEIYHNEIISRNWCACAIFFPEKWVDNINNDKSWISLKSYIYELAWQSFEYERNHIYYEMAFSIIQKQRNLKPNPYLVDTARHIFAIALGVVPGYIPSCDDSLLPIELLYNAFTQVYGLKYLPTLMQPAHFNYEQDKLPIYYSLQNPSTLVFSPKSRKVLNTLYELNELEHIMKAFTAELSNVNTLCSDTALHDAAKNLVFKYFHNEKDKHNIVKSSKELPLYDERLTASNGVNKSNAAFCSDARFLRGCVSIESKKK
jgi:hypothetical protein